MTQPPRIVVAGSRRSRCRSHSRSTPGPRPRYRRALRGTRLRPRARGHVRGRRARAGHRRHRLLPADRLGQFRPGDIASRCSHRRHLVQCRTPTSGCCSGCARYTPPPPGQPASAPVHLPGRRGNPRRARCHHPLSLGRRAGTPRRPLHQAAGGRTRKSDHCSGRVGWHRHGPNFACPHARPADRRGCPAGHRIRPQPPFGTGSPSKAPAETVP